MKLNLRAIREMISTAIATATADSVKKADLDVFYKLMEQFSVELATLRGRMDYQEAQMATMSLELRDLKAFVNGQVVPPGASESPNVLKFMQELQFYRDQAITRDDVGQFLYQYQAFEAEQRANRQRQNSENPV